MRPEISHLAHQMPKLIIANGQKDHVRNHLRNVKAWRRMKPELAKEI
jgi:hypothetical protein